MNNFPCPIKVLEDLLSLAKEGNIVSIISAIEFKESLFGSSISSTKFLRDSEIYGMIERVKLDIYTEIREQKRMQELKKQMEALKEMNTKEDSKVH